MKAAPSRNHHELKSERLSRMIPWSAPSVDRGLPLCSGHPLRTKGTLAEKDHPPPL